MRAGEKSRAEHLARVLRIEKEGVIFFERAHLVAREPKVREAFEKLANTKKEHVRSLEEDLKNLGTTPALTGGEKEVLSVYPIGELQKAECYVCGYSTGADEVPEFCPRCGASKYAFEKEISLRKVWEFVESGSRSMLNILKEAEKGADANVRQVLSKHIQLERRLLEEARNELKTLRTE